MPESWAGAKWVEAGLGSERTATKKRHSRSRQARRLRVGRQPNRVQCSAGGWRETTGEKDGEKQREDRGRWRRYAVYLLSSVLEIASSCSEGHGSSSGGMMVWWW